MVLGIEEEYLKMIAPAPSGGLLGDTPNISWPVELHKVPVRPMVTMRCPVTVSVLVRAFSPGNPPVNMELPAEGTPHFDGSPVRR